MDTGAVPVVSVVATDSTASEVGPASGTFTIKRVGSVAANLSVQFSVSGSSATPGTDYNNLSFGTTIPAGQDSITLTVTPIDDALVEGFETVVLTLVDLPAYKLGPPTAATITIADPPVPLVRVEAIDPEAYEAGVNTGTFRFTRTGSTGGALAVWYTIGGTAGHGTDYGFIFAPVMILAGDSSATRTVTPTADGPDGPETVIVTLRDTTNYDLGSPSSATVTITDVAPSQPTVTVTASDASASEVGPDPGTFTFTRTGATTAALTVNFTTTGSATVTTDYTNVGWTSVSIPIGETSITKTVTPVTDAELDPAETVVVTLAAGSYTIGSPSSATVTIADAPVAPGQDLRVTAISLPPAMASPGTAYVVTDMTVNQGAVLAGASTTRFYLSLDSVKGNGDKLMTGTRAIPSLGSGETSSGPTTVTIPASVAPGTYFQLACADDMNAVTESNEANNCRPSGGTMQVVRPDLLETSVSNPPATVTPGGKFTINDTVLNPSGVGAGASSTRYYLSLDSVKGAGDVLLSGARSVPALAAGASSAGSRQVTVPAATALQTYRLLACADDQARVAETNEGNNCRAATTSVVVGVPDLTTTQVNNPPATAMPGTKITLTDTVLNQGTAPTVATSTRYYLSLDALWSADDVLLTGGRSVPILSPGATSAGSKNVTIPLTTPAGLYFTLACADDTKKVLESNEGNNCVASASTVAVGP